MLAAPDLHRELTEAVGEIERLSKIVRAGNAFVESEPCPKCGETLDAPDRALFDGSELFCVCGHRATVDGDESGAELVWDDHGEFLGGWPGGPLAAGEVDDG